MMLVTAFVTPLHTTYATHNVVRPEPEPEPDPFLCLTSGLWFLSVETPKTPQVSQRARGAT